MEALVLVVAIGLAIFLGGLLAQRLRLPGPLVLLVFGGVLSFTPFVDGVELPPELVLLLFLPALLYWESINASLREIRANARVILLLSVVLVIVTALVVALVARAFGLSWPMALALGAILSPTDATAVAASIGRLPRRSETIIRTESLLNDGTALVLYAVAVQAAVSGAGIDAGAATLRFLESYLLGALIGLVVGFAIVGIRRVMGPSRALHGTVSVLSPFLAFLPAEALGVSGIVSVVATGLVVSFYGPTYISAAMREESTGFWQLTTYLLNGALFVLIGLELDPLLEQLGASWVGTALFGLVAAVTVLAVRIAWQSTTPYLIRALDRRPSQRARRVGFRQRFPLAWAGFRGAVSLAAALALPMHTASGDPLPDRETVIGVTFVVILFTLTVQGLTMPAVVRWARLPADPRELDEELLAEQTTLRAALDALPEEASRLGIGDEPTAALRAELERRLRLIHREEGHPELAERLDDDADAQRELHLAVLPAKRDALIRLRNQGRIDDIVLRRVQARIDIEELRLHPPAEGDD